MAAVAFVGNMIAAGGGPASGCKLNSYIRNTTTRSPLYSDVGLATPTTNPFVADADGRLSFYFNNAIEYEWVVTTSDGATTLWEAEVVGGVLTVTYSNGILIDTSWAGALGTDLGDGWATQLARVRSSVTNVYLDVTVGTGATGAQQLANTAAVNAAILSGPGRYILPPGTILFDGAWLPKADNITIAGCGENITIVRFTHSGDCITVGTGGLDANAFTVEDFTPQQASGTGYFIHHRKGRKVTVRRCGGQAYSGNLIRKFLKLGNSSVAITNVVNNGSGACRVTAASHGYTTNDYVLVNRVTGATGCNGLFRVTVIDANTFDLIGSTFGGAYSSGGATCCYAAFCILEDMSEVDVALDGIDIYSYAGEVRINNVVVSGNNFTANVPTTGSRGLKIFAGNAFDRFDGIYGRGVYGFIQFDVNVHFDNTRVTNIQLQNLGVDLFKANAFLCMQDNCDDTNGGVEVFVLDGSRAGTPYVGGGSAYKFDATDGDISQGAMLGVSAESYQTPYQFTGDAAAVSIFAEVQMSLTGICRAASGTYDFANFDGGMRGVVVQSAAASAVNSGNSRSVVRLETTVPAASVSIGSVAGNNFSAATINDVGGAARAVGAALVGTRTNDNAVAGHIGEVVESTVLIGSAVSLTNNTAANVTSISVTAGDWDVWGNVAFSLGGGTTITALVGYITTTSATAPTNPNAGAYVHSAGDARTFPTGTRRISLSATTTIYLGAYTTFAVSTLAAYGYIGARRVR